MSCPEHGLSRKANLDLTIHPPTDMRDRLLLYATLVTCGTGNRSANYSQERYRHMGGFIRSTKGADPLGSSHCEVRNSSVALINVGMNTRK